METALTSASRRVTVHNGPMSDQSNRPTPIPVMILQHPTPAIVVDGINITQAVESCAVEFHDGEMFAEFRIRADRQFVDFPCHISRIDYGDPGSVLDGITADDVDGWIGSGGMSTTPGQRVLRHLQAILEAGSQ